MGRYRIWFVERKSIVVEASDPAEALEAAEAVLPGANIEEVRDMWTSEVGA